MSMRELFVETALDSPSNARPGDIADILQDIETMLRTYVVFRSSAQPRAIALWIAHTYTIDAADVSAYLHITSPEPRCGKSRVLEVLELLVAKPWLMIAPTEAVLFRKIQKDHPTLLVDEVDALFGRDAKQYEGVRALLNAGHRRGVRVARCVGDGKNIRVEEFEVFGAKVLAGIGEIPQTLADRSIRIELSRRAKEEEVKRFRIRVAKGECEPIRERLVAWSTAATAALRRSEPELPDGLNDRAQDAWEPMLAIAELAGGKFPERARRAALELAGARPSETSYGVRLLNDIQRVLTGLGVDRIATDRLVAALVDIDDSPWAEWWGDRMSKARDSDAALKSIGSQLARKLKPYGIAPTKIRVGDETARGYTAQSFEEVFRRYLSPVPSSNTEQRNTADQSPTQGDTPAASPSALTRPVPLFRPVEGTDEEAPQDREMQRARELIASAFGDVQEVQE